MKDNSQLCVVKANNRVQYFYSCIHSYTNPYKSHRALKKHEKPCPCMGVPTALEVKRNGFASVRG